MSWLVTAMVGGAILGGGAAYAGSKSKQETAQRQQDSADAAAARASEATAPQLAYQEEALPLELEQLKYYMPLYKAEIDAAMKNIPRQEELMDAYQPYYLAQAAAAERGVGISEGVRDKYLESLESMEPLADEVWNRAWQNISTKTREAGEYAKTQAGVAAAGRGTLSSGAVGRAGERIDVETAKTIGEQSIEQEIAKYNETVRMGTEKRQGYQSFLGLQATQAAPSGVSSGRAPTMGQSAVGIPGAYYQATPQYDTSFDWGAVGKGAASGAMSAYSMGSGMGAFGGAGAAAGGSYSGYGGNVPTQSPGQWGNMRVM